MIIKLKHNFLLTVKQIKHTYQCFRFVLLEDCNHMIESSVLKEMITHISKPLIGTLLLCPTCSHPIVKTQRCREINIHFRDRFKQIQDQIKNEQQRLMKKYFKLRSYIEKAPTNSGMFSLYFCRLVISFSAFYNLCYLGDHCRSRNLENQVNQELWTPTVNLVKWKTLLFHSIVDQLKTCQTKVRISVENNEFAINWRGLWALYYCGLG